MRKLAFASVLTFCTLLAHAQATESDLLLLKKGAPVKEEAKAAKAGYVFKDKHWLVMYNPISLVFGGALFIYQRAISPQIMQGCAFDPSCSNFSKQCIHTFGVLKGVALTTDRLTRCTRLSAIDFHPVLITSEKKSRDIPEFYRLRK